MGEGHEASGSNEGMVRRGKQDGDQRSGGRGVRPGNCGKTSAVMGPVKWEGDPSLPGAGKGIGKREQGCDQMWPGLGELLERPGWLGQEVKRRAKRKPLEEVGGGVGESGGKPGRDTRGRSGLRTARKVRGEAGSCTWPTVQRKGGRRWS